MPSGFVNSLLIRARRRATLVAGAAAVLLVVPAALVLTTPPTRAAASHTGGAHSEVAIQPAVEAPVPSPTAVPELPPTPYRLPLLGTAPSNGAPGPAPRAGSFISVPAVGLQIGVVDYTDCNGTTPMTRSSAVRFGCTPAAVTTLVGHNPGIFTPLTRAQTGDRVHYQHDGVDDVYVISEIHRVTPQQAASYSQDGSYTHAVLATCAEPDSSAYWVFIALPDGAIHTASASQQAAAPPASKPASTPPPQSHPSPTPSPTPAGTTLTGGITLPPPPG